MEAEEGKRTDGGEQSMQHARNVLTAVTAPTVTGLQHEDKDLKKLHCSLIVCFHEQLVGLVTVPH